MTASADRFLSLLSDSRFAWGFVVFGAAARVSLYLRDRSLWLDEAMLAKAIVERSYTDLLKPLDYVQCSPIGFLWAERFSGSVLGFGERGLRLFPLLCGLASLVLLHRLARRLLEASGAAVAVILFACAQSVIYYSSEVKQYSTEVLVGLVLVLLAVRALSRPASMWDKLALAVAGAAAIGLSFTSVFLLFGIGLVWLAGPLRSRERAGLAAGAGASLLWLAVLGAYRYFIISRYDLGSQIAALDPYRVFWPLPPKTLNDALWPLEAAVGVMANPLHVRYAVPGLLLIAFGAAAVRERAYSWMIGLAIAAALGAAALRAYPFGGRLSLFLVPYLLIWLAAGIDALRVRLGRANAALYLAILAVFLYTPVARAVALIVKPESREEIKPALARIDREARPGDVLYVYSASRPAFEFYRDRYPNVARMPVVLASEEGYGQAAVSVSVAELRRHPRAWLLFTHCAAEDACLRLFTEYAMERSSRRASLTKSADAWLYLYENGN